MEKVRFQTLENFPRNERALHAPKEASEILAGHSKAVEVPKRRRLSKTTDFGHRITLLERLDIAKLGAKLAILFR